MLLWVNERVLHRHGLDIAWVEPTTKVDNHDPVLALTNDGPVQTVAGMTEFVDSGCHDRILLHPNPRVGVLALVEPLAAHGTQLKLMPRPHRHLCLVHHEQAVTHRDGVEAADPVACAHVTARYSMPPTQSGSWRT